MGFFDWLFGAPKTITPTVTTILPDAAKQEIMAGRLPRLNTDSIFLKGGEYCCFIDKALIAKEKKTRSFQGMSYSTPGLFRGDRFSTGRGRSIEHIHVENFRGILYITNRRVIFQAPKHAFDRPLRNLSSIQPYQNAVELQFGSTTYSLYVPNGTLVNQVLRLIK